MNERYLILVLIQILTMSEKYYFGPYLNEVDDSSRSLFSEIKYLSKNTIIASAVFTIVSVFGVNNVFQLVYILKSTIV